MKIALVHDYLGEFGGAERVLLALSEIWPEAPIFAAFYREGPAWERFRNKDIRVSWAHHIPGFSKYLYSPLRFLAPLIWSSFVRQLADYDLVISSASWYVTKGFGQRLSELTGSDPVKRPVEVCYCHTPPRYLYGYETSWDFQKHWSVRVYATVVNHFMRIYDFNAAQRVDYFIANSENVKMRIQKFYRREAKVISPPVGLKTQNSKLKTTNQNSKEKGYYLIVARIVGGKGLEMAVEAANNLGIPLKIVGSPAGFASVMKDLENKAGRNVEFLGFVPDEKLAELYAGAKAFLALARDEDFGITPVEAMQAGTPVIAYKGGGYLETVVEGKTGIFFKDYSTDGLIDAIRKFNKMKFKKSDCLAQGQKFSKHRFQEEIKEFVEKHARITRG